MQTKFLIPISIIVAGLLVAGAFIYVSQGKISFKGQLTPQEAADKAVSYINENKDTIANGLDASLLSVVEEDGIYKIHIKVGEGEYDSYVTKDGKFLFPSAYKLEEGTNATTSPSDNSGDTSVTVPKADNPDVKLFVMSYCPYGLQAQKMFLPVYDLLKDKAEMGVYFVDYIMHEKKEIDENLTQYCIQKEEKDKYPAYLSCFVQSGDSANCISQAGVNQGKIGSCVSQTDETYNIYSQYDDKSTWLNGNYPKFDVNSDLNTQYGVQGSPTIVINGQIVNVSPRSPERFKEIICQAFNSQPSECSETLSSDVAATGIGGGTASNSSAGGCGQ
ncbi:MAG: hypothetical protein PHE52_02030 [Candidatus Pacebacteria bacterium]|nr:hypothetical protein [Candidatus Paceibacterota bacterium]